MLQTKRKLPKVNRSLAKKIVENEEAEIENKDVDDNDTKKSSRKKKALSSDIFKDERFSNMFENKVRQSNLMEMWLMVLSTDCPLQGPAPFSFLLFFLG